MVLWVCFFFFKLQPTLSTVCLFMELDPLLQLIGSILMLLMLGNLGISLGPFHVLKAECSRGLMCPEKGGL